MFDPFITSVNTQKATLSWINNLSLNLSNIYTPGYREKRILFNDFVNGTDIVQNSIKTSQGKSLPGRSPNNLFIEGSGWFVVRKPDGTLNYTRLGDFKFDAKGTLVNELGYTLQGYLTDDQGKIIANGPVAQNPNGSANNPSQANGGTGFKATTDINMWVDPSNGKFYGKYDEYKVTADGTVMGVAEKGKVTTPLFKLALVNFTNPESLTEVQDNYYVPSLASGEPIEGTGEIRSGLIEKSNVYLRENVNYLQQARVMLDVTSKLINTNKTLLQESLRLLQ